MRLLSPFLILLFSISILSSCTTNDDITGSTTNNNSDTVKTAIGTAWAELGVPASFSWNAIKKSEVIDITTAGSNVRNNKGVLLGLNLPVGSYRFIVSKNDTLTVIPPATLKNASTDGVVVSALYRYGTVVAEDTYPYGGDYDMNDIVFDYTIRNQRVRLTAQTYIDSVTISITPRAMGVGNLSVYGAMAVYPEEVKGTVSGGLFFYKMFVEKNDFNRPVYKYNDMFAIDREEHTCFPITDDLNSLFVEGGFDSSYERLFINTYYVTKRAQTIQVTIRGTEAGELNNVDINKFKFVIINNTRQNEIPYTTSFGDISLKNKDIGNQPMFLDLPFHFMYPKEQVALWNAYPKFRTWVRSAGELNGDWMNYPLENSYVNY